MRPPFIIQVRDHTHPSNGCYVAQAGSKGSYTPHILHARRFEHIEQAKSEACENEVVRSLPALINL